MRAASRAMRLASRRTTALAVALTCQFLTGCLENTCSRIDAANEAYFAGRTSCPNTCFFTTSLEPVHCAGTKRTFDVEACVSKLQACSAADLKVIERYAACLEGVPACDVQPGNNTPIWRCNSVLLPSDGGGQVSALSATCTFKQNDVLSR